MMYFGLDLRGVNILLPNVRDHQQPLASGATSCVSKNRDRSPEGTAVWWIAWFGFFSPALLSSQLVSYSKGSLWLNYKHVNEYNKSNDEKAKNGCHNERAASV